MRKIILISILLLSTLSLFELSAQELNPYESLSLDSLENRSRPKVLRFIELGGSANAYQGDLGSYNKWSAAFELGYKLHKGQQWNGRIALSWGFVTGENLFYEFNAPEAEPNTFFRTSLLSLHYELHYNLIKTRRFLVYLSQGIGLGRFVPEDQEGKLLSEQSKTRPPDEVYGNNTLMLPTGLGAAFILKNGYGIGVQASLLNTQTDFLDNIAQWGNRSGNDNVLRIKFLTMIPIDIRPVRRFPKRQTGTYSR